MNITNSTGQIGNYQNQENNSLNGNNLLSQLKERVNETLAQKNSIGGNGEPAVKTINPQQVINFMAEISQQPLAGMNHNILI